MSHVGKPFDGALVHRKSSNGGHWGAYTYATVVHLGWFVWVWKTRRQQVLLLWRCCSPIALVAENELKIATSSMIVSVAQRMQHAGELLLLSKGQFVP